MMKMCLQTVVCVLVVLTAPTLGDVPSRKGRAPSDSGGVAGAFDAAVAAQPKLLRISSRVDGSGRIVFTADAVHYEHKHWRRPNHVLFDGEPWVDLARTPVPWHDLGARLDLSKAWIVERKGRDVIALEHTPDGFDLYLCDSPNGGADYAVTIAIPRRTPPPPDSAAEKPNPPDALLRGPAGRPPLEMEDDAPRQLHPLTQKMLSLGYAERQQLVEDGKLRDNMTPSEAIAVLGPPTTGTDEYLDWYHNPGHRLHVAPFYRAKLQDGRLYEWQSGNR